MIRIIFILFLFSFPLNAKEPAISQEEKKRIQLEAKNLGNESVKKASNFLESYDSVDDLLPTEEKGKKFDSNSSKEDVLNGKIGSNPVMEFIEENPASDAYLSENEALLSDHNHEMEGYEEICHESGKTIEFSVIRTLSYKTEKENEKVVTRKCLGHEEKKKVALGDGKSKARKKRKEFEKNPEIQWFQVKYYYWYSDNHDLVVSKWNHIENCQSCDNFDEIVEYRETESWKIADEQWVYNNASLEEIARNENSTLLSKSCLDNKPRIINETEISRCWIEKFFFRYSPKKVSGCDFLKSQFCKLKKSDCLKEGVLGCDLWKRTFMCHKKLNQKQKVQIDNEEFGLEDPIWEVEYEPNKNLADVVTKLEVFKEMDRDLENAVIADIKNFKFFSGKKLFCAVNFMENLVYDCCNKMGGLAVDGLLAECNKDELALSDLRNRGKCRYIGDKGNYKLGIKVSTENIYCCFPSKLARVFLEEAKDQLGLGWGSAEHPKCNGLTQSQIQQVDFNKINLSEAFEAPSEDLSDRLSRLQQKIQEKMKNEVEE
jgi:conjugal transfer mating pair stabilization protein TraN